MKRHLGLLGVFSLRNVEKRGIMGMDFDMSGRKKMEKIVDFVKENLGGVLITCFGVLVPGALTIAVFKMELYSKLDILKLLYLSAVISSPSFMTLFCIMGINKELKNNQVIPCICEAAVYNILIFAVPLFWKLVHPGLSKAVFAGVIGVIIIACFVKEVVNHEGHNGNSKKMI